MSFVAATDTFVRVFMSTMAAEARRYGIYIVASNTQAPFALTRDPAAVAALRDPATPSVRAVYAPTAARAYDQAFLWGPRVVHEHVPAPLANLIAVNRKTPLTSFETTLGFAPGPSGGAAAIANLRPVTIPGTGARLGFATSLPAFVYGPQVPRTTRVRRRHGQLHALPRSSRRQRPHPGRRQRRCLDRRRWQRQGRALAAAVVDGVGVARGQRSQRPLRLRGQPDAGRQPRRYAV